MLKKNCSFSVVLVKGLVSQGKVLFKDITGITINTCEDPEESVVRGLVKIVSDSKFRHLAFSMKNKILK